MNPQLSDPLSVTFSALADPTRRAILARLAQGETSVGDLVKPFSISGPAISRHLRVLENASLIERKVNAQWRICRLNPPGLRVADSWLSTYRAFWEQSLDRLVEVLEQGDGRPVVPTRSSATSPRSTRRPRGVRPKDGASRAPLTRKRKSP
jgi:DNA-binding transcriptional ArsR family regulator